MSMENNYVEVNGKSVRTLERHDFNTEYETSKKQVFIVGSKGIPAAYGGFETFVEKLTEYQKNPNIRYHVARIGTEFQRYEYNGAKCFTIKVPEMGAAKAIYYDIVALKHCIDYCKARPSIEKPIFYVLACRIGPFIHYFKKEIEKLGGVLYVNPDGHEWKRAKWSAPVRAYWRLSEKLMVKHADLLICDSKNIQKYIKSDYAKYNPNTTFIAYGSDVENEVIPGSKRKYDGWLQDKGLTENNYYLVVGRFVPENNFETMIREFMSSKTKKDFAIITTDDEAFMNRLEEKLHFSTDSRIKFVGTVYDQELLKEIRKGAYGNFHGHEVGGTNPTLLEALGCTDLNLLIDVGFSHEVALDAALYWNKEEGNLARLIEKADMLTPEQIEKYGEKAKRRIKTAYSWEYIVDCYEEIFLEETQVFADSHNIEFIPQESKKENVG